MRKNDLLKLPKLKLTKKMTDTARNDTDKIKDYSRYYRAVISGGILKVAVWSRKGVMKQQEPDWEIYIDKESEKWINYSPIRDCWSKARIENLNMASINGDWYGVKGYDDVKSRKIVNDYFFPGEEKQKTIRDAVLYYQGSVARKRLESRNRAVLEQIDTVMNRVPELPKDFEEWVVKDAYSKSKYMIYDRSAGKARCTACWGVVEQIKGFRHNESGRCPLCREEVTYKSWYKQKVIHDRKKVGIMQRMKDNEGYVLRVYESEIRYLREENYSKEFWCHEDERLEISDNFQIDNAYVWDQYKHNGPYRWVYEYNMGFYQYRTVGEECILYHKNLDRILKGTDLRYIPARKLFAKRRGLYSKTVTFFREAKYMPQVEVLIKVGLYRAAYDMTRRTERIKEWNRESPWKYLGISKDYFKMAVRHDMGRREINVMASAAEHNMILNKEQIEFYTRYFHGMTDTLFELGHKDRMYRYLKKLGRDKEMRLGDYMDYLEDLSVLHIPMTDAVLFPKNFETEHLNINEQRREKEKRIEKAALAKKNRMFRKLLPKIRELYECEDENLKVIIPSCKADFQEEGRNNHNCVGGSYFDKMMKEECVVVFLRKKEDLSKSYCTVEFDMKGRVRQNRSMYNKAAPPEAEDFINKLSADVRRKIKEQEEQDMREIRETEKLKAAAG